MPINTTNTTTIFNTFIADILLSIVTILMEKPVESAERVKAFLKSC